MKKQNLIQLLLLLVFSVENINLSVSSPANPLTNISNDALGFFGAYTIRRDTVVISHY